MNRKVEIVDVVLDLLAGTPLEKVTTRQVAGVLGVTQPALFRHFRNREALLLAVVNRTREALAGEAERILREEPTGIGRLRALASTILGHVEGNPGLPRLIFGQAANDGDAVSQAIRHIVAMQRAAVQEFFMQGQREGDLSRAAPPQRAASLYTGMIQGTVLQWQMAGRPAGLADEAGPLVDMWLEGVAAGPDAAICDAETREGASAAPPASSTTTIEELDVRPIIARGQDPLETILAALELLARGSVLLVEAPFRPAPLLVLLDQRGHGVQADPLPDGGWIVEIVVGKVPVADLRELETPEPLERVLEATSRIKSGEIYLARLPRFPRMLIPHLEERELSYELLDRGARGALLLIRGGE